MMRDPMMDFLCEADMTWHSAFMIFRSGETHAIVGQVEKQTVDEMEAWLRKYRVTRNEAKIGNRSLIPGEDE